MTRGCEVLWGSEQADRAQLLIEDAVGGACPCMSGLMCPLIPAGVTVEVRRTDTGRAFIARVGTLTEFEAVALNAVLDGLRERVMPEVGGHRATHVRA